MPASRLEPSSHAAFPTTRWSQVVAAGDRAGPAARDALAELCSAYWDPLDAFVRRKGHPPGEAADLVQGTFLTLLDRDGLAAVAPDRGRFRSFLMAPVPTIWPTATTATGPPSGAAACRRSRSIAPSLKGVTRPSRSMS